MTTDTDTLNQRQRAVTMAISDAHEQRGRAYDAGRRAKARRYVLEELLAEAQDAVAVAQEAEVRGEEAVAAAWRAKEELAWELDHGGIRGIPQHPETLLDLVTD